jgi:hypothetical protein
MNLKKLIAYTKHEFKKRYFARRFNVWTEKADPKCKSGCWISYDHVLYFGHPWFLFYESHHNIWWKDVKWTANIEKRTTDRPPSDDLQPGEDDNNPYANCHGKQ